jgi:hypothetical protein
MNKLITAERVYALAFSSEEPYSPSAITEADIAEAESRYLLPIIGEELYIAISSYGRLKTEYIEPMVAAWVRYIVEPHLATRCCTCYAEGRVTEAVNVHMKRVMRALREKAVALTRRLSDHLNSHSADYVEYNPETNPLNRCFIYGNIVQVY